MSPQTKLLIADLKERRTAENAEEIDEIIRDAEQEKFHSYLSPLPMPICFLRQRLQSADLLDLDENVIKGRYRCKEEKEQQTREEDKQTTKEKEEDTVTSQQQQQQQMVQNEAKQKESENQEKEEKEQPLITVSRPEMLKEQKEGRPEKKKAQKRPYIERPVVEMLTKRTRNAPVRLINEISRQRLAIEREVPKEEKEKREVADVEQSCSILAQLGAKDNGNATSTAVIQFGFGTVCL